MEPGKQHFFCLKKLKLGQIKSSHMKSKKNVYFSQKAWKLVHWLTNTSGKEMNMDQGLYLRIFSKIKHFVNPILQNYAISAKMLYIDKATFTEDWRFYLATKILKGKSFYHFKVWHFPATSIHFADHTFQFMGQKEPFRCTL